MLAPAPPRRRTAYLIESGRTTTIPVGERNTPQCIINATLLNASTTSSSGYLPPAITTSGSFSANRSVTILQPRGCPDNRCSGSSKTSSSSTTIRDRRVDSFNSKSCHGLQIRSDVLTIVPDNRLAERNGLELHPVSMPTTNQISAMGRDGLV